MLHVAQLVLADCPNYFCIVGLIVGQYHFYVLCIIKKAVSIQYTVWCDKLSQEWYQPTKKLQPGQLVPFLHKIYDCRSSTGQPHNFSLVGQYHFCIEYIITEVVSASQTILAWLADTSLTYNIYDCRNGTGWPHNINLVGQYHLCIEYMITEVIAASQTILA